MLEKLTELLDSFIEMGVPGYDCVVKHHGKVVYRHSNGYSDAAKSVPIKGDEHYFLYSCSKVITCTAVLQLYEKGLFALDDELAKYMPEFAEMTVRTENGIVPAKNKITIRNLFMMTAGFSYDLKSPSLVEAREATGGRCPTRETMRFLAKEPLLFEPGTNWAYSLCHDVLAAFVEVLTGVTFNEYVTEHIFKPLGMNDTTFLPTDEQLANVVQLFSGATGAILPVPCVNAYQIGTEYASGGAGCYSTLEDYSKFLEGLRSGETLLKRETINLMATDMLEESYRNSFWKENYGYGLGVRCPRKGYSRTDFGWGGAAGAYLAIDLTKDYTVFYVQHVLSSPNGEQRNNIPEAIEF